MACFYVFNGVWLRHSRCDTTCQKLDVTVVWRHNWKSCVLEEFRKKCFALTLILLWKKSVNANLNMCCSISIGAKIVNLEKNKRHSVQQHVNFQQFNFSHPSALCFLTLISKSKDLGILIYNNLYKFCVHFVLEKIKSTSTVHILRDERLLTHETFKTKHFWEGSIIRITDIDGVWWHILLGGICEGSKRI